MVWLWRSSFPGPSSVQLKPLAQGPVSLCPSVLQSLGSSSPSPWGSVCWPQGSGVALSCFEEPLHHSWFSSTDPASQLVTPSHFQVDREQFLCSCAHNCTQLSSLFCLAKFCLIFFTLPSSFWLLALLAKSFSYLGCHLTF